MALDVIARLVTKLPAQEGVSSKGSSWTKQEFIVETQEQYPKKICMNVWGDKVNELNSYKEGEVLKFSLSIESREFNQRWYTDVRAWRIERLGDNAGAVGATATSYTPAQPSANIQSTPVTPIEPIGGISGEEEDDLPF